MFRVRTDVVSPCGVELRFSVLIARRRARRVFAQGVLLPGLDNCLHIRQESAQRVARAGSVDRAQGRRYAGIVLGNGSLSP